jgi:hypothetical protein
MQVMHHLPILSHHGSPVAQQDITSKMQRVVDVAPCAIEESCLRYRPANEKINEPPKVISLYKENGFDYFSPVMKYRG